MNTAQCMKVELLYSTSVWRCVFGPFFPLGMCTYYRMALCLILCENIKMYILDLSHTIFYFWFLLFISFLFTDGMMGVQVVGLAAGTMWCTLSYGINVCRRGCAISSQVLILG